MTTPRATDTTMPTALDTARANPMRPPPDSPRSATQALRVFWQHPSVWLLTLGFISVLVWRLIDDAPLTWWDAVLCVAVWAVFPFVEWLVHVHLLHFRPRRCGRWTIDFYLPRTHRRHHAEPWILHWVFIPRHVHALVFGLMLLSLLTLGGWRPWLLTVYAGFLIQGLHYEWVHYLAHISWQPPWAYYARRVREHRYHHFRHEQLWWSVSRGLADVWLGTAPDVKTVARSGGTTDLGIKG